MSNIKNVPQYKNGLLRAIRVQLEYRALRLDLPICIAEGDDVCSLRYHQKDTAETGKA